MVEYFNWVKITSLKIVQDATLKKENHIGLRVREIALLQKSLLLYLIGLEYFNSPWFSLENLYHCMKILN